MFKGVNLVVKDEYVAKENYDLYGFYENRIYKKVQLRDINTFIYCGGKCGGVTLRKILFIRRIFDAYTHIATKNLLKITLAVELYTK